MNARNCRHGLAIVACILLVACDEKSSGREPTAPDIAADPSLAATGSDHITKFLTRGWFGDLWFYGYSPDGVVENGYLSASQGGNGQQVYMYYDISQCDDYGTCNSVEGGYGNIPSNDLVEENGILILNTDTRNASEFYIYAGTGGAITITWKQTPGFTVKENRSVQGSYGSLKTRAHEKRTYSSALAEGSMMGRSLEVYTLWPTMGTVHFGEVDIEKNVKPQP